MSEHPRLERFHLKNLDCASCASKLENRLRQVAGVHEVVVDFASLTLHIKADDLQDVVQTVRRIEPQVELVAQSDPRPVQGQPVEVKWFELKKEIAWLFAALIFFAGHLVLQFSEHVLMLKRIDLLLVLAAYFSAGWNVFRGALTTIRRRSFFDEHVLMVIATFGALAIQAYSEAVAVMLFYKIGELLQETALNRSRRSIQALLAAKPNRATLLTPSGYQDVSPEEVKPGATIMVKPGEKIPLDGMVIEGRSLLDTAALTGESVPIPVDAGESVMAGQISKTGALTIRVTRPFVASSIARVMDMVEHATARKARTEKFITTFARFYTPSVVIIAAAIALLPPLLSGAEFQLWVYRALVILVISCPCALVISVPLGYFGGIGRASREGILIKGSNFIDALAAVKTVVFDKTGTLTQGHFKVKAVVNRNGYAPGRLLELAAAAEMGSNHPIAAALIAALEQNGQSIDPGRVKQHTDFSGQGVSASYDGHTIMVGNDRMLHLKGIVHQQCEFDSTVAHVIVDDHYAGHIIIGDEMRPDASVAVKALRNLGVSQVVMFTGDNACSAREVSSGAGLDDFYADLLPEDKVRILEKVHAESPGQGTIAFVGDGINDAPAIARADVGIAMGGIGSDAAVETADVVLIGDSPLKTALAIAIARRTRRIVRQNIVLAFAIKGIFIGLGALGMASMWEAVFADMGTALVAVANATRILKMKMI